MKLTGPQKLEVSYYFKEGFSACEIAEIVDKPEYLIAGHIEYLHALKRKRIKHRGETDRLLFELLVNFKIHVETNILQRSEVKKLIKKIEFYLDES